MAISLIPDVAGPIIILHAIMDISARLPTMSIPAIQETVDSLRVLSITGKVDSRFVLAIADAMEECLP